MLALLHCFRAETAEMLAATTYDGCDRILWIPSSPAS